MSRNSMIVNGRGASKSCSPTRIGATTTRSHQRPEPVVLPKSSRQEPVPSYVHEELQYPQDGCPANIHVEVHPGLEMKLRSSSETVDAINRGFVRRTTCLECALAIGCIRDAKCILCPHCLVLNPLEMEDEHEAQASYGIGLGFVLDE